MPTRDGRSRRHHWRATAAVTSALCLVLGGCTSAPDPSAAPPAGAASSPAGAPPSVNGSASAGPSGSSSTGTGSAGATPPGSGSTSAAPSGNDSPPADALIVSVLESGGKVTPNGQKLDARVGQQVILDVTSDRDDVIHAHIGGDGYELKVAAGVPTTGTFTLASAGSFDVESHDLEKLIVILNAR
jgi:hypothetical protein